MAQGATIANEQASSPLSSANSITLRIARYNPEQDSASRFVEFAVPYEKWTTVLDAILVAGSCSQVCPKGVDPAMGIQLLRGYMLGFKS